MTSVLVIDEAGRVLIPQTLRDELHLEVGDALEVETAGEKITLRPVRATCALTEEQGVWVFHSGEPLSATATDDVLNSIREDRDRANLGDGK